jgi:hypothetical protein
MYKKASSHAQERVTRAVQGSTHNDFGIDESVWATADESGLRRERERLVTRKRQLQGQLTEIKARTSDRRRTDPAYKTLATQRARIVQEERTISDELRRINQLIKDGNREMNRVEDEVKRQTGKTFHDIFYDIAKEMLAGPVFARLQVAAEHRFDDLVRSKL